jgi:protein tyrosine/serine phosphatase
MEIGITIARAVNALRVASALVGMLAVAGPVRAESGDLPNFHLVAPGVYRGAAPTPAGLRRLRAMGVRTVIDLRIAPKTVRKEKATAESLGLKFINLPMSEEPPTQSQVDTLLSTLRAAKREPVYVHCQHGADRTGCMLVIYRETEQGWNYDRTYKEMRRYGFKPYYVKLAHAVQQRAPHK